MANKKLQDNWYPKTSEDWQLVRMVHFETYGVNFDNASQSAVCKALSIKEAAKIAAKRYLK